MPEELISGLFDIQRRYIRSANLQRDFADPSSMDGYVVTAEVKNMLARLHAGLQPDSSQRAWRITGDYGSGKSSFALLVAHVMGGRGDLLPARLKQAVRSSKAQAQLLPVLVMGSREPIAKSLLSALLQAVQGVRTTGPAPLVLSKIHKMIEDQTKRALSVSEVIEAVEGVSEYAVRNGRFEGTLIIVDELGKTLEYSALHPEQEDVFVLQALAEAASRSGRKPIFVLGLLHQGFNAYAESLSQAAQREWEKVAGRFDELVFSQPIDQVAELVAHALRVKTAKLPVSMAKIAAREMDQAVALAWYGASANRLALHDLAAKLYPLHPTVLPVLVRLFNRFGQNERSLFSFLLSNEPFGLQEFSNRALRSGEWFRLNDLYDYTRMAFGHRLGIQSYRSHWNEIDSVVESYPASEPSELALLKIVGLLNLVDSHSLVPSTELLNLAWENPSKTPESWKRVSEKLLRKKRVLYFRGDAAGYCLWPHTSVNLERAYEESTSAVGTISRVSPLIAAYLEDRPIVARRHYIQTGNLRHFSVQYVPVAQMRETLKIAGFDTSDGRIVIVLCDTEEDRQTALRDVELSQIEGTDLTLVAIPRALNALTKTLQEAHKWQWIMTQTPELNHDRYAAAEVSRRSADAVLNLRKALLEFVGLQQGDRPTDLRWFTNGRLERIGNGRQLLSTLSTICDRSYPLAPRIKNELVNRRSLSSAAAAARMRLIERIFAQAETPRLGVEEGKTPPEVSMYLSVLVESKLHSQTESGWTLSEPLESDDPCQILPAMRRILEVLLSSPGSRTTVDHILRELRKPPYGVRDGLGLLLLAVFVRMREQDLAMYEDGSFMREIRGEDFLRVFKYPASFELQFYEMNSVRRDLFRRLSSVLQLSEAERERVELLDIVRPLCMFASNLPLYSQKTLRLSESAISVRKCLLDAREPAILLFESLPVALNISAEEALSSKTDAFIAELTDALEDLRIAYPSLLDRINKSIGMSLQLSGVKENRVQVRSRAAELLITMTEPRLRAFCLQLADQGLGETEWIEGLASLICSKPPSKWGDRDIEVFDRELTQLARGFVRLESLLFAEKKSEGGENAIRVAITHRDGTELERVVFLSHSQASDVQVLGSRIASLLEGRGAEGEIALANAFWKIFSAGAEQL